MGLCASAVMRSKGLTEGEFGVEIRKEGKEGTHGCLEFAGDSCEIE